MKRLSLRVKMLLSVGAMLFVVLGVSTVLHIRKVEKFYPYNDS